MKKIFSYLWTVFLILFLFSFFIMGYLFYNGFQKDVSEPKSIYSKLFLEIRTHRWNDSNVSFTRYIIKNGERIVKKNHNPITLLDTSNEYRILLAYIKYLEFKGEHKKAYNIYINIFKGFQNIENSYFNLASRLLVEDIVYQNLDENFKNNIFSKNMINILKKELQSLLIINKIPLLKAIEYEFNAASKYRNEYLNKYIEKNQLSKIEKELKRAKFEYIDKYQHEAYLELVDVVKKSSFVEANDYLEQKEKKMYHFLKDKQTHKQLIKLKNNSNETPSKSNYLKLVKFQAKTASLPQIYALYTYLINDYSRYLERVKKNRKLLGI